MNILFIDTHSNNVIIYLKKGEEIFSVNKLSLQSHSIIVMDLIKNLLDSVNIEPSDLDLIIVINGPGSFTGVRIGVTIAKTMAYALNIDIKTITSLEAFGVSALDKFDLVTVSDSKGVYSAKYDKGKFYEMEYRKKSDFDDYVRQNKYVVLSNIEYNFEKIISYLENHDSINPHNIKPIYIKEIDVLK